MKIILASKSGVRKKILDDHKVECDVIVSNVDEDEVKFSLQAEGADPLTVSKNLAEIKSIKGSSRNPDRLVLGGQKYAITGVYRYQICNYTIISILFSHRTKIESTTALISMIPIDSRISHI